MKSGGNGKYSFHLQKKDFHFKKACQIVGSIQLIRNSTNFLSSHVSKLKFGTYSALAVNLSPFFRPRLDTKVSICLHFKHRMRIFKGNWQSSAKKLFF